MSKKSTLHLAKPTIKGLAALVKSLTGREPTPEELQAGQAGLDKLVTKSRNKKPSIFPDA